MGKKFSTSKEHRSEWPTFSVVAPWAFRPMQTMNLTTSNLDALFNFVRVKDMPKRLLPAHDAPYPSFPLDDDNLIQKQLAAENWVPLSKEEVARLDKLCIELTFNLETDKLCNYIKYDTERNALRILWAQTEECIIFHDTFFGFTHLIKRQLVRELCSGDLLKLLTCMNETKMIDLEFYGPNCFDLNMRVTRRSFQVHRQWRIDNTPETSFIDLKTNVDAFLPDNGGPSPGHPNREPARFTDYSFHGHRLIRGTEMFASLTHAERYANIICKRLTSLCQTHGLRLARLFDSKCPRFRTIIWEEYVAVEDHLHPYTHLIPIRTFFDPNSNLVSAIDRLQFIDNARLARQPFHEWLQNYKEPKLGELGLPFNELLHTKTLLGDFSLPEPRNTSSPIVRTMLNIVTLCLNERHLICERFRSHPTENRFSYRLDGTSIYISDSMNKSRREITNAERAQHWGNVYKTLVKAFKPWGPPFKNDFHGSEGSFDDTNGPPSPIIFARFRFESIRSSEDDEE
jgi:hypothetical protein